MEAVFNLSSNRYKGISMHFINNLKISFFVILLTSLMPTMVSAKDWGTKRFDAEIPELDVQRQASVLAVTSVGGFSAITFKAKQGDNIAGLWYPPGNTLTGQGLPSGIGEYIKTCPLSCGTPTWDEDRWNEYSSLSDLFNYSPLLIDLEYNGFKLGKPGVGVKNLNSFNG